MYTLKSFYKSRQWINFVAQLRNERTNDQGYLICEHCGKPIVRAYDCIGHHKIELTEDNVNDFNISLNPDNVALIHFKCHNEQHSRWNGFRQTVYIVYGAPCAGKRDWVERNANKDDLIIDIDSIFEMICTAKRYDKPKRLNANVFGVRDCLIDQIKTRRGKWRNAFILGGFPLQSDRQRLQTMLDAQLIYIEATEQECLERSVNRPDDYREYIEEWFDCFVPDAPG